ncbi:M20/M25/M40 family metallo-hydrolase [Anaerosacchariphilus polymeriproducens]|uniref:M20/M25/M40 family metallo-hydrolase n=1 Tax=Anaerosacchariphilus polymeriproducens TaxID=1812858 RepID=A0A371AZS4_9FIRM|nr:M20/M25/M40 family metallo-hydrolase [Anaerosacchariphilus polymeriproducens]RDU25056.1 M20/M25/M40 family metallo-hydrolase [Anaerosacchariphilus polymeriproducens]
MYQEMLQLTKELVGIPSVNTTPGEKKIGQFIENYIRDIPYFKEHSEQVIVQPLKEDPLERRNVFALLIGEKEKKADTIFFHGHTDTVGIEDYASLEAYACDVDELMEKLKEIKLPIDVKEDLESGDYIFGRGALDMKSGDAVFLTLLKEFSQKVNELSGNILVSFNPVEENLHTGILEGILILHELKEKYGLVYKLAINNDYICPLYPGDTKKYVYTGAVGKLLPCFYIQGKETHVGQCFEGFDAAAVAAKLVEKINLNTDFCDEFKGEYTLPPAVLKMKDLKEWYNVQTPNDAFVYFNYFVHNASMECTIDKLKTAAAEVFDEVLQMLHNRYKDYCRLTGQKYEKQDYQTEVLTYQELLSLVQKNMGSEELEKILKTMAEKALKDGMDKREIPIPLVRFLLNQAKIMNPVIVLFFAAPFCPHNTLQDKEEEIVSALRNITKRVGEKFEESYQLQRFFPSLTDSSYLKIDDDEEAIELLCRNFPEQKLLYPLPFHEIKSLNIPAVNFGGYGKDAHKWSERVNISYTFQVLPELIKETVDFYLS